MPNNSNNLNAPKIGMNTDSHDLNMEKGHYSFALNATVEDFDGNGFPQIQNDSSNILAVKLPLNYQVIGRKNIPEIRRTIFALVNPLTGQSEFGEVKDCIYDDNTDDITNNNCDDCISINNEDTPLETVKQVAYCKYSTIINDDCLKFNIDYPVDIEYRLTAKGVNIYFVGDNAPLRFVYFEYNANNDLVLQDRFKVVTGHDVNNCGLPIYGKQLDCNKIKYNPDYSRPCIETVDIISGGSVPAGTVQALVAYADELGNPLTKYFPSTERIPIHTKSITVETNYITDKAVYFKINNLEQSEVFNYYNIVIAQTVDNFTEFRLVATLPITQETYTYTGNESYLSLTANDVFFERPIYYSAGSITKANDYLFFSRLKEYKKLNLQRVANWIKLYWQTKAISELELRKARNVEKYRGFLRDEPYPLGIVFEMIDDNDTIAFHIPGPSKEYFRNVYQIDVDTLVENNDVVTDKDCVLDNNRNKLWEVYNTAQIIATPHVYNKGCEDIGYWEWGDFAYWESKRTYPNIPEVWGELCGQPIRHHKFPDSTISHIHDMAGDNNFLANNVIYPIGIKVDHNSVVLALNRAVAEKIITQEERDRIKGYRIVRGNRAGNESIVAKGLLYDMNKYNKYNNDYYYANYPYNDVRPDIFLAPTGDTYKKGNNSDPTPINFERTGRYTFHSPNTHFSNPSGGTELKLETEEYGLSEGYFNKCQEQAEYKVLSTAARSLAFGVGIATAISSITKQCRTITKNQTVVSALGLASGTVEVFSTDPTTQRYNTLVGSVPEILPKEVSYQDCKGTPYQWLEPFHIAEFSPSNVTAAALMGAVVALGGGISNFVYLFSLMLNEMEIFANTLKSLLPKENFAIQYNSVGKYNNFKAIPNAGFKRRKLDAIEYLSSKVQVISENVDGQPKEIRINNWDRESSLYLKTDKNLPLFPSTSVVDNSRVSLDSAGLNYGDLNKKFTRTISSYYASIKNYVPDQYGSIYNIEYLETSSCGISINTAPQAYDTYFGGDTFINRFALKIKQPFFLQTRFRQLDQADVLYSELGNIAYPNYFMDIGESYMSKLSTYDIGDIITHLGTFYQDLVGTDDTRFDAKVQKLFHQKGYIHLYNYGIPYFLCESDVNVDYRHGENDTDKDFYPHQTNLDWWLQEKNVPLSRDNTYIYNKTYSRQNKESVIKTIKPQYKFNDELSVTHSNKLIYTEQNKQLKENDNWLILRANNFWDIDLSNGKIVSIDGIENAKVLIRSENVSQIFNAFDTLKTESTLIQVDKGGIFANRPQDFAITDLGYMGSQHRDILKTEYGHVFADAKRGQVFLLNSNATGIDELGKNGMRNWFKQNLPFQLLKDIPNLKPEVLDNNYKGLGLHLCFDKRFNRFFLTKLDYKLTNKTVKYNGDFYIDRGLRTVEHTSTVTVCEDGYEPTGEGKCIKIIKTPAQSSGVSTNFVAVQRKASEYAALGSVIYNSFNVNGTGNYETINTSNPYWINSPQNSLTGPLNRCGIWNSLSNEPLNEWVGITVPVNALENKVYYIGIAGDNKVRIKIGCKEIVNMDVNSMMQNHDYNEQITFIKWHIYPVPLKKGLNYVELAGMNFGNIAVFGAEIYDNTKEEIINATSNNDLNIVFSTSSLFNTSIDNFKYTCEDCSAVVKEGNDFFCISNDIKDPTTKTITVLENVPNIEKVNLGDPKYFKKLGWTISYNFLTQTWVSYHSFIPNYYIDFIDHFQSGINGSQSTVWSHNVTNKSYQVYYGKLYPFTIDIPTEPGIVTNYLNSIEYMLDVLRYHNQTDWFYNTQVTFNKAVVYNERQCSGVLELIPKNEDDFSTVGNYPNILQNSIEVEVSNSQNMWSFNGFYDFSTSQKNNVPLWLKDINNVDKRVNMQAINLFKDEFDRARIRGRGCHVRLTNDKWSNYKMIFFLNQFNQNRSFR